MMPSTISSRIRNGSMPRIASPTGAAEMVARTKRLRPTGGCTRPISMLWVKMIEHGVDAERLQGRRQDRQHQEQRRRHLKEAAEHEQQQVDQQQELPGCEI